MPSFTSARLNCTVNQAAFRPVVKPLSFLRCRLGVVALALTSLHVATTSAIAQCTPAWVPGIGTNLGFGSTSALAVLPGGDVIVGANPFSGINLGNGVTARGIARVNPASNAWSALGSGITSGSVISAIAVLPDGDIIVGGSFSAAGAVSVSNIARYDFNTNTWSAFGSGVGAGGQRVNALAVLPGGDVIVGGSFIVAGGIPANNIARLNPATGIWSALGYTANTQGTSGEVFALAVGPGGDVLVGGTFSSAGGNGFTGGFARYYPSTNAWTSVGPGQTPVPQPRAITVAPNGDIIVAGFGTFSVGGGPLLTGIGRYTPVTNTWSPLGLGISGISGGPSPALAILPGGDIVVGGNFTTAGGVPANRIARYNPASNQWSPLDIGTSGQVLSLAVLPDGDLIVGGQFGTAGGLFSRGIARYFPCPPCGPEIQSGPLPVLTARSGTALFGVSLSNPADISTTTFNWRKDGVPINATINPSAATALLALSNVQSANLGSYDCVLTSPTGCTTTSPAASLAFAPSAACSLADVAGAGGNTPEPDGILDGTDFIEFINAFAAGC